MASQSCICKDVSVQSTCISVTITNLYRHRLMCPCREYFYDYHGVAPAKITCQCRVHAFCDDHKFVPAQTDVSVQSVFFMTITELLLQRCVSVRDNHIPTAASKSCSVKINLAATNAAPVFALRKYSIRLQLCKSALCRVTVGAWLSCYRC